MGIEWGHGHYLTAKLSEIDFAALKAEYCEPYEQKGSSFPIEIREVLSRVENIEAETLGDLPELMNLFKEVADIKTADQLNLPTPEAECHNIVTEPAQYQQEMVKELSKRAEKVYNGIDSHIDNMLKITSDGRKLGLDQRLVNPLLPDDPDSKVNVCVDNVYRIWEEHADTKAAQLIFCDIGTPKNDGGFNIYDDIRDKRVQCGIPKEQVRYIHEANSDVPKKRTVRQSTQRAGACADWFYTENG